MIELLEQYILKTIKKNFVVTQIGSFLQSFHNLPTPNKSKSLKVLRPSYLVPTGLGLTLK